MFIKTEIINDSRVKVTVQKDDQSMGSLFSQPEPEYEVIFETLGQSLVAVCKFKNGQNRTATGAPITIPHYYYRVMKKKAKEALSLLPVK